MPDEQQSCVDHISSSVPLSKQHPEAACDLKRLNPSLDEPVNKKDEVMIQALIRMAYLKPLDLSFPSVKS